MCMSRRLVTLIIKNGQRFCCPFYYVKVFQLKPGNGTLCLTHVLVKLVVVTVVEQRKFGGAAHVVVVF